MDWKRFLHKCSLAVTEGDDMLDEYNSSPKDWLGFEPATLADISKAEERLQIKLPPSYKEFLLASNGFKQISCFIWDLMPADRINWIDNVDPDFANLFRTEFKEDFIISDKEYYDYTDKQHSSNFRDEYLVNTLAVSGWGDSAIVLLNPLVKFGEEWEAWIYANWYPGARRFKSFEELMMHEHQSYLRLRSEE